MMHKFSKTGEYAKKRLKIALAEDRSTISASDNMTQIKKEIKSSIMPELATAMTGSSAFMGCANVKA